MGNVMKRAVKLAKLFEGDWQARMSLALKISWKLEKGKVAYSVMKSNQNEWRSYGHHRIYVEGEIIAYFDAWGTIKTKHLNFKGFYDVKKEVAVKQGGDSRYEDEVFAAINESSERFNSKEKTSASTGIGFIRAQFDGYEAETGEAINEGDLIFYCGANDGYCLAHNA